MLVISLLWGCGAGGSVTVEEKVQPANGHVSLAWDAPTQYVDGTTITGPVGYKVYYGTASGAYTKIVDVQTALTCDLNSLPHGTWYFAVTCYDSNGSESDFSNEINTTL